ncbi:MAG: DUF6471 domain-containing protein [Gammaproteobacteria bacterium]
MTTKNSWESIAPKILKGELLKRGMKYHHLIDKLKEIGIQETESNIKSKLSRGSFNVIFFLQALHAIGVKNILLDDSLFEGIEN